VKGKLLIWLSLLSLAALTGCGRGRGPEETVQSAVQEAQDGHLERFLEHFDQRSKAHLGMFWALSQYYGYIDISELQYMSSLDATSSTIIGDSARVAVSDGRKEGVICLKREGNRWNIDLLARDDCFGAGEEEETR